MRAFNESMPAVASPAEGRDGCAQARHALPSRTTTTLEALKTGVILLGSRQARLAARGAERRDADGPAERDRTADHGAPHAGLAAVGRIAQGEPRQLHAAANHAAIGLETRRGDAVVDARNLAIEPGQLALAYHIDEAGPGFAVQGLGLGGVALPGPVRVGRPRPLG